MTAWLRRAVLLALALLAGAASAHEMSMAEMELREMAPGEFVWQWTASNRAASDDLTPVWPSGCRSDGSFLRCGPDGLQGELAMRGQASRRDALRRGGPALAMPVGRRHARRVRRAVLPRGGAPHAPRRRLTARVR